MANILQNCIYNMDAFEYLPQILDNSIDLVLIDPPYEIARPVNFEKGGLTQFHVSFDFGEWDYNFVGLDKIICELFRVLKKQGTIICFYDLFKITKLKQYLEDAGFIQIRFIEWLKTNPVPLNSKVNYLTGVREIALTAVKTGNSTFNSEYDNGVYNFPINHEKGRFHPTQKPVELIEALIRKHSNENDVVLDCFMGSGTTAIACQNTSRIYMGCEKDSHYHKLARGRIEHNRKPKKLF